MALRDIRIWPDPAVCTPTEAVAVINSDIRTLVDDMFETMYASEGIGLAANQVGVCAQVVVMDLDPHQEAGNDAAWAQELASWGFTEPLALINPTITHRSGQMKGPEGCLSVPGVTAEISRSSVVEVSYHDRAGKRQKLRAKGLLAVCIQHELDHLAGRVFVEYLPEPKQAAIKRALGPSGARKAG